MANVEFRQLRATAARWMEVDPILDETEIGYERGTGRFKLGDGKRKWSALPYFIPADPSGPSSAELLAHIQDPNPHPAWDDGTDFVEFYQNAKVQS